MKNRQEPNVYFTDPVTGEEYISSPELDVWPIIMLVTVIGVTSPFWIGLSFWLTMSR